MMWWHDRIGIGRARGALVRGQSRNGALFAGSGSSFYERRFSSRIDLPNCDRCRGFTDSDSVLLAERGSLHCTRRNEDLSIVPNFG